MQFECYLLTKCMEIRVAVSEIYEILSHNLVASVLLDGSGFRCHGGDIKIHIFGRTFTYNHLNALWVFC